MKVILTEKPSVAFEIAKTLKINEKKDGYIEGNNYCVTWAFGHLIELQKPSDYGYEFKKSSLPFMPSHFKLRPKCIKDKKTNQFVPDPGVIKQLHIIERLFEKSDEIIVATDAGREGELIFRYIYSYLKSKKPFKRLWISSQTDKAILEGFNNLQDGRKFDNLYLAAKARSESDWLVGLNSTAALTLDVNEKLKNNILLSLGRVQTPTLLMVVSRYLENKNFKPSPFWRVVGNFLTKNNETVPFSSRTIEDRGEAEKLLGKLKAIENVTVKDIQSKKVNENPPLLHDLSSLQQLANSFFGFSASQTLDVAQKLYEKKLITYPRTGSNYIGEDVFETIPDIMTSLKREDRYKSLFINEGTNLYKKSVNDEKVTDHHALLPTGIIPGDLSEQENKIFNLIVIRMVQSFSGPCVKLNSVIETDNADVPQISGSVVIENGWKGIEFKELLGMVNNEKSWEEGEGDEGENDKKLPPLNQGDFLNFVSADLKEGSTKAKPLHTEGTLLKAMETCGKEIENEEQREALKNMGIGTPATRAGIIEVLFERGYIQKLKNKLIPTPRGVSLYKLFFKSPIGSPTMTGQWENKLLQMEQGKVAYDVFISKIKDYSSAIIDNILSKDYASLELNFDDNIKTIKCPKCSNGQLKFAEKNIWCDKYKDGCDFTIFRTVAGKKLTDAQLTMLLEKGMTNTIKGFTSKSKKSFDASLKLDNYNISFVFDKGPTKTKKRFK